MRLARVIGTVTLNRRIAELRPGQWLLVDAFDAQVLEGHAKGKDGTTLHRKNPMPESLVVYDELGAGAGQIIAVSEGREAAIPFHPDPVVIDAYCSAIIDNIDC